MMTMMMMIIIISIIIIIVMVMVKMVLMKMIWMDGEKKVRVMMSQLEDDSGSPKSREMIEIEQPKDSCSHNVLQWIYWPVVIDYNAFGELVMTWTNLNPNGWFLLNGNPFKFSSTIWLVNHCDFALSLYHCDFKQLQPLAILRMPKGSTLVKPKLPPVLRLLCCCMDIYSREKKFMNPALCDVLFIMIYVVMPCTLYHWWCTLGGFMYENGQN